MSLRQDKRSRDRQGAVSPPQESGPAISLRPTQGDHPPGRGFRDIVKCCGWARSGGVLLNHQTILEFLSI